MTDNSTVEWPAELTTELRDILGMPNFACAQFIPVYRAGGYEIPHKSEAEQAFFLHRCVLAWTKNGPLWREAMGDEMDGLVAKAKAAANG